MDWGTVILSLSSAILASALTLLSDRYFFKVSTKEKYREKLVDKQIEAYGAFWHYYQEYADMYEGIIAWWKSMAFILAIK